MSEVELSKGRGAAEMGKRGCPSLSIGLAGAIISS